MTAATARFGARAGSAAVQSGASLAGTVSTAYEQGGMRGVAQATVTRPLSNAAASMSAPVRDAYAQGAAYGLRATAPAGTASATTPAAPPANEPPQWAQQLRRNQRLRDAAIVAAGAVREGDRPMGPANPELKDDSTRS